MARAELVRFIKGIESTDPEGGVVKGRLAVYKKDGIKTAIRMNCGRLHSECAAFVAGKCSTDVFVKGTDNPVVLDSDIKCGQTEEGLEIGEELP